MHPPDQAKHNKPSLDANGRLEVIFYDVLCIVRKKNRPRRLSYNQLSLKGQSGSCSGKWTPMGHDRLSIDTRGMDVPGTLPYAERVEVPRFDIDLQCVYNYTV